MSLESDMEQLDEKQRENIRKYIRFLHDEDGWSDLIDSRWKDEVKDVLMERAGVQLPVHVDKSHKYYYND